MSGVFAQLKPELPSLPDVHPNVNGLEAFKLVAAQQISKALDVPLQQAFDGLESNKKEIDLNVPVPKFRLKGDQKGFAQKVADEVRCCCRPPAPVK